MTVGPVGGAQEGGPGTFSEAGSDVSAAVRASAARRAEAIAIQSDRYAKSSSALTQGESLMPLDGFDLTLGSRSTTTIFSRDATHIQADRTAVVSSDHTTRVVARQKVEIQSPRQIEVAGGDGVRLTSSSSVAVVGHQLSLFAATDPGRNERPLNSNVSMSLLAEKELRLKSARGGITACSRDDFVIHSHEKNVKIVAKQKIQAQAESVTVKAGTTLELETCETSIGASSGLTLKGGKVVIEGDSVLICASTITLDGNVIVTGNLDVAGEIRS